MSLRRRLLLYLLISAPLVWLLAAGVASVRARTEVNELFDTELIRLARQVQIMRFAGGEAGQSLPGTPLAGEADLNDLAIVVWDRKGRVLLADHEGTQLPARPDGVGFVNQEVQGQAWRIYYLQSPDGEWTVAAGQYLHERDELVYDLIASQLLPWLLTLPLLLLAMGWAVRAALAPMRAVADDLQQRSADDLHVIPVAPAPAELQPVLQAMNGLFGRIEDTLARERRFTSDAAHELRTPLAVLSAQWDRLHGASDAAEREQAMDQLRRGIARMSRLVDQLLRLSRLEATSGLAQTTALDWPALARLAMGEVLPIAERRQIQLDCVWPAAPQTPPAWQGDAELMTVLLRNLLDNAARYAPAGSTVTLRFGSASVAVENEGPALPPETLARLGERFHRPEGQQETGSGLGVSIVRRIAALHGLALQYRARPDGRGVVAEISAA